jgi:Subtilisin inhibitor-like
MRIVAVLCLVAAALGASLAASTPGSARTSSQPWLKVSYWPTGDMSGAKEVWTLRCNPPGGTLARPLLACQRVAAGGTKLFTPVPRDAVCTEIYGGPHVARVIGVVDGARVWANFNRRNGCQIGRWDRLSPWLLPEARSGG